MLAESEGVSVFEFKANNSNDILSWVAVWKDANLIYPGQKIRIPIG